MPEVLGCPDGNVVLRGYRLAGANDDRIGARIRAIGIDIRAVGGDEYPPPAVAVAHTDDRGIDHDLGRLVGGGFEATDKSRERVAVQSVDRGGKRVRRDGRAISCHVQLWYVRCLPISSLWLGGWLRLIKRMATREPPSGGTGRGRALDEGG